MKDINTILSDLKKSPKQMMIVVSVATVALVLAYGFFFLKPQITGIFAMMGRLVKVSADLRTAKSDISKIGSMKSDVDAYNKKVDQYEKTLPAEDGIPGLLESLSEMANKANVSIAGIVPLDKKIDSKAEVRVYKEIPILITAKSGYHELGNFLSALEKSDRFMKVADIQIKADKASPKRHNIELMVVTYVLLGGK